MSITVPEQICQTDAVARLLLGDLLHMEVIEGEKLWWFEGPYQVVDDGVVQELAFSFAPLVRLVEAGDSLFRLKGNSQTWRAA